LILKLYKIETVPLFLVSSEIQLKSASKNSLTLNCSHLFKKKKQLLPVHFVVLCSTLEYRFFIRKAVNQESGTTNVGEMVILL